MTSPVPPEPWPETSDADTELVARLAERGVNRRYGRHVVLIQEGDHTDGLFIIRSGRLKAYVEGNGGREFVLGIYGPQEYVGEMSLDGGPRSASVRTLEPTVCSVVSRAALSSFIHEYPAFAFHLLARVIRRARMATESARNLALLDVYGRIAGLIRTEAIVDAAHPLGRLPRLSHQEIANRVGCSREMVSRILKDLTTGGYVGVDNRGIEILRPLPSAW